MRIPRIIAFKAKSWTSKEWEKFLRLFLDRDDEIRRIINSNDNSHASTIQSLMGF